MDWQLRIALIIAGCALIGYVYYDYAKKKKIQKENEKLKKQFSSISENVDSAGFDHVGVGSPRPASATESDGTDDADYDAIKASSYQVKGATIEQFIDQSLEKEAATDDNKVIEDTAGNNTKEAVTDVATETDIATERHQEESESCETQSAEMPNKAMVLSLILQAPQGTHFKGKDFLPLFLSQGLRHGEMGIFHRRTRAGKDPGPVLFSLANGIAPGTFDINNMENFETPALACFVTLPGPDDAQVAYNAMYKTCLLLQQELGGELLDETKSVYSKQTHNHRLDQIKDYSFKFGG